MPVHILGKRKDALYILFYGTVVGGQNYVIERCMITKLINIWEYYIILVIVILMQQSDKESINSF